jgi:uncharacterized protein (DUF362 family)/NAD-dependent dihydropyrimidine dehydrogenase PreA subunit
MKTLMAQEQELVGPSVPVIEQDSRPVMIERPERVAIVHVEDYDPENVRKGLERLIELLDLSWMSDLEGKTVLLKPNGLAPMALACTHPVILDKVATLVEARGATVIAGDSNMNKALTTMTHKRVGFTAVAAKHGFPMINFLQEGKFVHVSHVSFEMEPVMAIPEAVAEADVVINLPRLKTHGGQVYTGAIKNFMGLQPNKMHLHAKFTNRPRFQKLLGDMQQSVLVSPKDGSTKPVLHVLDGIVGMDGKKGPSSGNAKAYKVLMASTNPAALDAVGYSIMGGNPKDLVMIQDLAARNAWPVDIDQLEIVGDDWKTHVQESVLPAVVSKKESGGEVNSFMLNMTRLVVKIDKKQCKRCLQCVNTCPMGALSKQGDEIVVDGSKCISCYCCGEICPNGALEVVSRAGMLLPRLITAVVIIVVAIVVLDLLFRFGVL